MVMTNENGGSLIEVVIRFFREDQWNFQKTDQKQVIRAGYRGEHGTWVCYARVEEESRLFLFNSLTGLNIPPQYRPAVVEYLTRVNSSLSIGNFEMDFHSGDVRFRTSLILPDNISTEGGNIVQMIRSLVYINTQTMDHYFPGVVAVVHGGLTPEAALSRIEATPITSPQQAMEAARS